VTEKELRAIYRDAFEPLYAYVSRRCGGDRQFAEDVTQETWLRAVRAWRRGGRPARPMAWLTTVARNLVHNEQRRRRPLSLDTVTAAQVLAATGNGLGDESAEIATLVGQALARLPGKQRRLLEAFHYEKLSVARIADLQGISERAIEGRLRRARQNLRRELQAALDAAGGSE
jgi:RNA polymerase sigma-70 factor (ECF subfamily)